MANLPDYLGLIDKGEFGRAQFLGIVWIFVPNQTQTSIATLRVVVFFGVDDVQVSVVVQVEEEIEIELYSAAIFACFFGVQNHIRAVEAEQDPGRSGRGVGEGNRFLQFGKIGRQ